MPPPTESSILSNFLLPPAPLPTILTLAQFTELFPRKYRSHPQVAALYRSFQHQRAIDIDDVKNNIAAEVQRGEKLRRQIVRSKKVDQVAIAGLDAHDIEMDAELLGSTAHLPKRAPHTVETLSPELERACADIEAEIESMESEAQDLLNEIKTIVGDLSDLRYGRFARAGSSGTDLGVEVVEALQGLEEVCDQSKNG